MNKDSIITHLVNKHDSLRIILSQQSSSSADTDFDVTKTLVTALIGAVIGQAIIFVINLANNRRTRKEKQKLIVADLSNQLKVVSRLKIKLTELDQKFEKRDTLNNTSDAFHDLQTDIYESVPKPELHKIFKNDIFKLVDIYKSIRFLQENSIANLYDSYLTKLVIHQKEKQDDKNHDFFCSTHLRFIELTRGQIKNNLKSIAEMTQEMNELIKIYS